MAIIRMFLRIHRGDICTVYVDVYDLCVEVFNVHGKIFSSYLGNQQKISKIKILWLSLCRV